MHRDSGLLSGGDSTVRSFGIVCTMLAALLVLSLSAANGTLAATYYVDSESPSGTGDGLSWGTAKRTIQAGIDASAAGDTILVKYGSYLIDSSIVISSTRLLTSDDGTHDSWDSADPDSSLCVVLPYLVSRGFTITGTSVTAATRLRGFKVFGGEATGEATGNKYGGGIYVGDGADPVIENCWITNNVAVTSLWGGGGGIACEGAGTEPVIRYNDIGNNIASTGSDGYGGGIYASDLTMCQIYGNTIHHNMASAYVTPDGGGMYLENSVADIWSNTITENVGGGPDVSSGADGGGISIFHGVVEIWDNVITYNRASDGWGGDGGGIHIVGGNPDDSYIIRDNPAISYNIASTAANGRGGGILIASAAHVQIRGNTLEGNVATTSSYTSASYRIGYGGAIYIYGGDNEVTDNVIWGNTASLHGAGYGGGLRYENIQTIQRNIFALNTASAASNEAGYGGGCWFSSLGGGVFANNTFYRNANVTSPLATGAGSGVYHVATVLRPPFVNNIIVGHDVPKSDSVGFYSEDAYTISYNCFYNNPGGNYNVNVTSNNEVLADPRLADPDGGDFSLMYDSPCIEEGDPSYTVPENGAWVVDMGAIEYTGKRHWRPVAGTGELLFGGRVKAKVNVTTLGTLSEIDMVVHPGETHALAPVSVARWYDIDHVGSGAEFDLTLSYLDSELNGQAEDSLCAWRWTGSYWEGPKIHSARDLTENWITVSGQTSFSDWILTSEGAMAGAVEMPRAAHLHANYPNPFGPATTISYQIARASHVNLAIYDAAGRLVKVLVNSPCGAGDYQAVWDGSDEQGERVASGVYFYRLGAGDFERTRKMVLLR